MQTTTILIDGCNYGVADVQIPKFGPDGMPTGEMLDVNDLFFDEASSPPSMTRVIVRFIPEQFAEFLKTIGSKTVVPATAQDLVNLNGAKLL